ncbi:hypothetical protein PRIPAC_83970 [Pristionchus pacificus]|uniref:MPN domain-containing protein n=1 Tax=Pristionchus pacificus TaxID=54126 RepID=A0A2A6BGY9_PRIPA|nr:hypothetical protein PRIPAC_83970 [Pristionchus pacificus]|eukprot:PDM65118.1 hypothetical protein PRIPAC_53367 [Pristionchus pacificus]
MTIEVDSLPYATIVLHALKYPSKAVYGLLLGEAKGSKVKVNNVVPLAHEASPLSPSLEIALTLVSARPNGEAIVGVYYAPQNLKETGASPTAIRLAQKIAAINGSPATIVELQNVKLEGGCQNECLTCRQSNDEGKWKELSISATQDTLTTVSLAAQRRLYREVVDFENHLDSPESDFYNAALAASILEAY